MHYKIIMKDALIGPNDPLYPLTVKYQVKISRSSTSNSNSIYVFRKRRGYRLRIGHPISSDQIHLRNFADNEIVRGPVTVDVAENMIKKHLHQF